jgi:hypothetical protein
MEVCTTGTENPLQSFTLFSMLALGRVWESSNSAKTAPELQNHEISRWSSSTVDLKFQRVFGTAPDLPSSL